MADDKIRILCLHGLGDHRGTAWGEEWQKAVAATLSAAEADRLEFRFATYDPLFEDTEISFADTVTALWKLGRSGVGSIGRKQRGIVSNVTDRVRWTAGYVVAWVEDKAFQAKTRAFVLDQIAEFRPHMILAHSLGSLVSYNALTHPDAAKAPIADILRGLHYVTLGSQLGNPFVIGNLTHGRVQPLPVRHWHHLYNEHDDVFTAQLKLQGVANFTQLLTPFDLEGTGDHAAYGYLGHAVTVGSLWRPLVAGRGGARAAGGVDPWLRTAAPVSAKAVAPTPRGVRRRALLVGINAYPREADQLEGCVNDVFTMSAVLQECGFAPEEIRTCLDSRATAEGIKSRLEWLVDDAQPGDQRVFYYSGHGARVPEYGEFGEPDRLTETLVPWDFDWTPETSVSDEQIYAIYSQLPYEMQLVLIFDCCHSGSMHRQGGARVRGITPPDDIRHRELKWDIETEMWVEREFERINQKFSARGKDNAPFFGRNGSTVRLGRSSLLRLDDEKQYRAAVKAADGQPVGPYLPLIIEACGEEQYSYEYRHGVTSYGAFTFCLASLLRKSGKISFRDLVAAASARLKDLRYEQTPQILGPNVVMDAEVPWNTGRATGKAARSEVPGVATPRTTG